MGKTKNSKMLRQEKKNREEAKALEMNNNIHGLSKIKKRLDKELNADVKLHYNNNPNGRKISEVISEMIQPLMDEAKTFKEKQNIVRIGVMAWNLGVMKINNGEEEMQKAFKSFGVMLPKEIKDVLLDYCDIKCKNYSEYNELIIDYEFTRLNSHQNNLTVSYKMIKE